MQSMIARSLIHAVAVASFTVLLSAGAAFAQEEPKGEPVKWDQARVTQYSVELTQAIADATQAVRQSPMQNMPAQRMVWYELKEDLRLLESSARHLQAELQAGNGLDETQATFERIDLLRRQAEEHGRRSEITAPVMDALVKAGSLHNRMRPYYLGLR